MMTWWNDFDNPTLNHKGAERVRSASTCASVVFLFLAKTLRCNFVFENKTSVPVLFA